MKLAALSRFLQSCFLFSLLVGCDNASTDTKPSLAYRPLESFPAFEPDRIGTNETEKKSTAIKKFNSVLVFHANDTMQVKKVYTAALALAKNAALDPIIKLVLDNSEASDDSVIVATDIDLGKRMKAELIDLSPRDDPSFIIKPLGYNEQNLNNSKHAIWQWNLEPLKEGEHKLMLSVEVISSDDNRFNLPARKIPVRIFAKKDSFFTKVGNFWDKYWQWIITGILIPIFIAWMTSAIKQRNDQKSKPKA